MYLNILLLQIVLLPYMTSESNPEIPAKKLNRKIPPVFFCREIEKKPYSHRCDR